MYCDNCGAPLRNGAKFCRNCGASVASDEADDVTRVMGSRRSGGTSQDDMTRTRVMPQTDRRRNSRGTSASSTSRYSMDDNEPIPTLYGPPSAYEEGGRRTPLIPIIIALIVAAAVGFFAFKACSKGSAGRSDTKKDEAQTQTTQSQSTQSQTSDAGNQESQTDGSYTGGEAPVSSGGTRAGGPETDAAADASQGSVSQETLDAWSDSASSFMYVYPVNHILAGGEASEPAQLSIEDWADVCLRYVDPSSDLGQALLNDPDSVADALGFYQVASYVSDVQVTGQSAGGINVCATVVGTQMDWENTSTYEQNYLVQFNGDGLITGVVSVD